MVCNNKIMKKVKNVFLMTSLLLIIPASSLFIVNETNTSELGTYDFRKDIKIRKYSDIC